MKLTLAQSLEAIVRGETPEKYVKRIKKLRKYNEERDWLELSLDVLKDDPTCEDRYNKKKARLKKVLQYIEELQ